MRFGYSILPKRFQSLPKQVMVAAGLIMLPFTMRFAKIASAEPVPPKPVSPKFSTDPRTVRLVKFFSRLQCPVLGFADDFIHAADENHLDWRLLPSIAVIESGGGKAYKNNNIFGWDNGEWFFPSISSGIREVAYRLGRGPLYRNRDIPAKLRLYNPDEHYGPNVMAVMRRISPVVNLQYGPHSQLIAFQN
jgi:hypothetical protein